MIERGKWTHVRVADIMRTDVPVVSPSTLLRDAVGAMEAFGIDRVSVCEGDRFVGVVSASDLIRLDEILDIATPSSRD